MKQYFPHILHGADYNPEQWRDTPEIWDEDVRLMKLAGCNVMAVSIFAWTALEPEEGKFDFSWLDTIMDKLYQNQISVILATPSGARPAWMSQKYPEVLRVNAQNIRMRHGKRHNHCFTSPIYRKKTAMINTKLAERYQNHPALILWHISNEYYGECYCDLCQEAFRNFLKDKYHHDLDKLNHEWWAGFWSHTYTDWSQVEMPSVIGETGVHGQNLDFNRFITHQTIDFMKNEIAPIRNITPDIPITTNFMGVAPGLDYFKFAKHVDIVSWDSYPEWKGEDESDIMKAAFTAFCHDLNRSLKNGQPFMLMESTPSLTNWQEVCKPKRPGMHKLSSIQAIAHGSDTVQYFQWRKSRGSSEKFHGAVVDHCGHERTRVFQDVATLGKTLKKLDRITGATTPANVAILFDWENRWAIQDIQGLKERAKHYVGLVVEHYSYFWKKGISVDVIDEDSDISKYALVVAPMTYMVKPGYAEKVENFTSNGGTYISTFWSGIVNENDLCFLGGFPGPLRKVLGIWSEEIDTLYDDEHNVVMYENTEYKAVDLCDVIHAETAEVLATYKSDFYAEKPALTVNQFGKGKAYYIAFKSGSDFLQDFYDSIIKESSIQPCIASALPEGVSVAMRENAHGKFVFVMNFSNEAKSITLDEEYTDMEDGSSVTGSIQLHPVSVKIYFREAL